VPVHRALCSRVHTSPVTLHARARAQELVAAVGRTGLSMDLGAAQGSRTSVAAGPEVRISIPGAVIGTDVQRMTDGTMSRLRLFFTTQF
jgi:hypothetical protein